jgi:hypothetical protein
MFCLSKTECSLLQAGMVLGVSVNGKTEYLEAVGSNFHLLMIYFVNFAGN